MNYFNRLLKQFRINKDDEIKLLKGFDVDRIEEDPVVREDIQKTLESNTMELEEIIPQIEDERIVLAHLKKVQEIPEEELSDLEELSARYSEIMIRKGVYQDLIDGQDEDTMYLEKYLEEIPKAIDRIAEFEVEQGKVKKDMYILEGEKGELNFKKNRNLGAFSFTKVFLIFIVIIAAIVALVFTTLSLIYNKDMLVPGLVIVVLIIVSILWVSIFRRYLIHDLKRIQKLQGRAVELLNKTKLKYIKNQALLDYEYKKYRVNSSEMLRLRWENLAVGIENEKEFNSIEIEINGVKSAVNRLLLRSGLDRTEKLLDYIDYFGTEESRKKIIFQKVKEIEKLIEKKEFYEKQNRILAKIIEDHKTE